jgi:hypothetical protein
MASPPTGYWAIERDDFGKPVVVRHRHAEQMVTGYIRTDTNGQRYAQCQECGAGELLEKIEAAEAGGQSAG